MVPKILNNLVSRFWKNNSGMADSISYIESTGIPIDADVPLETIVKYRETDMKFQLAVMINTSYSVGMGFHNTADTTTPTGRTCLEMINEFCDEWNLDELNQLIGMDVWASGNAFLEPLGTESKSMLGVGILPLSSIIRIGRDQHGDIMEYVQQYGGPQKSLPPTSILHFRWLPRNNSAWGTGLGQPLAKQGVGYKTQSGKTVCRPSMFAISEMLQDVSGKMTFAGLPRFKIFAKVKDSELGKVNTAYNKLDPLQHIAQNFESAVDTISLDTNNKFDSFIRNLNDEYLSGIMTPIPRMFSSLNFTYASADAAIEAYLPLIRMYQRAHKRFIENHIYKTLIMQEKNETAVKKAQIQLNWGQQKDITMDEIRQIYDILKDPKFDGMFDPEDILDMIRSVAPDLKQMEGPAQNLSRQARDLYNIQNQREKKVPFHALSEDDKLTIIRQKVLQKIMRNNGIN